MGYQRRVHGELTSEQTHFHSFNAIQILNKSFNRIQILNKNFNGKEFQLDIQSSILSQQLQLQVTIAEGKVDQEREEKWKFKERCWVSLGFPFFFSYQLPRWPGLRIGTHRSSHGNVADAPQEWYTCAAPLPKPATGPSPLEWSEETMWWIRSAEMHAVG